MRGYRVSIGVVSDDAGAESGDLLECQPRGAVFARLELEQREHTRREPAGAHLVARKRARSTTMTSQPARAERARAGRAGRTAADHQGVAADHVSYPSSDTRRRASTTAGRLAWANTTWKSCIHPVANAAWEPARYSSPGPRELLAESCRAPRPARLEALAPVRQRPRVVQAQVLDVEHRHAGRREHARRDLGERRRIGAGEDAPADPGVERARHVAADEVQQAAAAVAAQRCVEGRPPGWRSCAGRRAPACRPRRRRRTGRVTLR